MNNEFTTPKNRHARINDIQIAYRVYGEHHEGVPLVLLPRFRATMDDWDPELLQALAARREVIVFDNAGVGASDGTTPGSVHEMAELASAFIQWRTPGADVLGWSMGGMVALSLALHHSHLIRRVVVAGSTPGGVEHSRPAPAKVWEVAGKPVNDDEDFLYLFFPHTEAGREAGRAHLTRLAEARSSEAGGVKPESVMAQVKAIGAINGQDAMFEHLPEIGQPVLMANGAQDIMVHAYASYAATERLPDGQCLIYPASGHGFLFQHAGRFAGDALRFLDG